MQQPPTSGRATDGSPPQSRAAARRTRALPLRPQDEVECRRCHVHCDKVVYPAACLERSCPFVYAYEDHGHTFMGCMQKVYTVEIDIDLLRRAEASRVGFGGFKAKREPLPMCKVEVDKCFEHRVGKLGCINPEFFEVPRGEPTFKVIARGDLGRR